MNETSPVSPPSAPMSTLAGFFMGAADAVPGVSGGTIALILGIYERFIASLHDVVSFPRSWRSPSSRKRLSEALKFLVPLGVGVIVAYYLATKLLVGPTESPGLIRRHATAPLCYAFFFGLVVASLREPWKRISSVTPTCLIAVVVAAIGAAVFVGLPHATSEPPSWALLVGGALAIVVMLLPGVSGSLLLVILGQYTTVAGALHDRRFDLLGIFFAGIVLGVALFVPLLRKLLRRHHDVTMAALTGLMAGSLRALWPWKDNYELKRGEMTNIVPGENWPWVVLAAVAGAAAVMGLRLIERRIARN